VNLRPTVPGLLLIASVMILTGCVAPVPPKDYTELRKSRPHSILVLPPINDTTEVAASYSVLTTVTRPLAELGYYVFPVVLVDQYLQQNGVTVPNDMHQVPIDKLRAVFGADTVLYLVVEKYGSKYQLISANTFVHLRGKLVDCRTGIVLWEGRAEMVYQGQSGLIEALVTQVLNKLTDQAHGVASMASYQLLTTPGQGFPKGPRHSEYDAN
jgi:hypothetical protein